MENVIRIWVAYLKPIRKESEDLVQMLTCLLPQPRKHMGSF